MELGSMTRLEITPLLTSQICVLLGLLEFILSLLELPFHIAPLFAGQVCILLGLLEPVLSLLKLCFEVTPLFTGQVCVLLKLILRLLELRFQIALLTGLDALAPYHDSAPGFLAAAISPDSAVSPFGADAAAPREMAIEVFRRVVDGSTNTIPAALKRQLPELLWMAYMGLTLFWVYDNSPEQAKSRKLATRASRLFGTVLPLARLPFARGPLNELLDLVKEARA